MRLLALLFILLSLFSIESVYAIRSHMGVVHSQYGFVPLSPETPLINIELESVVVGDQPFSVSVQERRAAETVSGGYALPLVMVTQFQQLAGTHLCPHLYRFTESLKMGGLLMLVYYANVQRVALSGLNVATAFSGNGFALTFSLRNESGTLQVIVHSHHHSGSNKFVFVVVTYDSGHRINAERWEKKFKLYHQLKRFPDIKQTPCKPSLAPTPRRDGRPDDDQNGYPGFWKGLLMACCCPERLYAAESERRPILSSDKNRGRGNTNSQSRLLEIHVISQTFLKYGEDLNSGRFSQNPLSF